MCKEKSYYYNHLGDRELVGTDDIWLPILKYGIRTATHFEAHFPDDDSYLAEGKEEVRELPQISVMPWSGMKGAIAVHGEMTPEARALFLKVAEERKPRLWSYVLFRNGKTLLEVWDHHDRIVWEDFIREYMQKVFESWFDPIPEQKQEPVNAQGEKKIDEAFKHLLEATKKEILERLQDDSEKKKP